MIMASRLVYGMARQGIVPSVFGRVLDGAADAAGRDPVHDLARCGLLVSPATSRRSPTRRCSCCSSSSSLVNVAVLVLRRDPVDHDHFRAPTVFPVVGIAVCVALMTQKSGETYARAGALLALGVAFWLVNRLVTGPRGPFDTRELEVVEGR